MDSKNILSLFNLDYKDIEVSKDIIENEDEYIIVGEVSNFLFRNCPKCGKEGCVKEKVTVKYNLTLTKFNGKKLILLLTKRRFKCNHCGITWVQKVPFVENKRTITNDVIWSIYEDCKRIISFCDIAKKHNVSLTTVINIFDKICNEKSQPLRICVSIDEFYFKVTKFNKFPAVLSDAKSGRILDIISSRKKDYLDKFFAKKSLIERQTVKFFSCDLNDTYRKIAYKWLPNCIVIADFFHVTKLLTNLVDIKRIRFMKTLEMDSWQYKFVKKYWKYFLANNKKLYDSKIYFKDPNNNDFHISEAIFSLVKRNQELLEMYLIYRDYQTLMTDKKGEDIKIIKRNLEFIINKCLNSLHDDVVTLGSTLLDWSTEIINAYSNLNKYGISNGIAECNNNRIEKLIDIGNGYRNLERLKKRILLIEKNRKSED